jgi:PAS domain S-box-containing protein
MLYRALATAHWKELAYPLATASAAVAIFIIDTFTSFGFAVAVLYAVVVVGSANFLGRQGIAGVGAFCMGLTALSYAIVHGTNLDSGPSTRALISLCAIAITTLLAVRNQDATQHLADQASLLDLTHDAIIVGDMKGIITYWNMGAEALYGWPREEAVGRRAAELLQTKLPANLESILQELERTGRWQGELVHRRRDGTELVVASRWSLQRDARGQPVAAMSTNNDITEQKRAEDSLGELRSELAHVSRLSTLGELTASIAHEVNQPLAAVVASGEACLRWLSRDVPDIAEVRRATERIIASGKRAGDVVSRLRALARKGTLTRSQLTLNDIVEEVLPLVEREFSRHMIEVRLDLDRAPLSLLGDRIQLQQVVINLVINAVQAMSSVEGRPRRLFIRSGRDMSADGEAVVLLEIADTGIGFGTDVGSKLFTPFYTTKDDGMGMGLSICRSIVEAHGGQVWAAPADEHGASFTIKIPTNHEGHA